MTGFWSWKSISSKVTDCARETVAKARRKAKAFIRETLFNKLVIPLNFKSQHQQLQKTKHQEDWFEAENDILNFYFLSLSPSSQFQEWNRNLKKTTSEAFILVTISQRLEQHASHEKPEKTKGTKREKYDLDTFDFNFDST